jgi:hypothetical protein
MIAFSKNWLLAIRWISTLLAQIFIKFFDIIIAKGTEYSLFLLENIFYFSYNQFSIQKFSHFEYKWKSINLFITKMRKFIYIS